MEIKGFVDVSFSDWDGKISSVVFLPRCNLRCPFCYNKTLVLDSEIMPTIARERIMKYLEANRKWIDGVVITGGEPTTHRDLPNLCGELKRIDYQIKIDTNGTNPTMMQNLIENHLVNYIALDLKAPLSETRYHKASGVNPAVFLDRVKAAIQILLDEKVDYEFRTTLVPKLHRRKDVEKICQAIKGCKKYALQNFKSDVETIDPRFHGLKPFSQTQMETFLQTARKTVPNTILRG